MSAIKTNVMRILDKEKSEYEVTAYDATDGKIDGESVAKKIGKVSEQVFKTLVARGHTKAVYVFLIPVIEELDFKRIGKITGEKSIDLLPLNELQKTTGYIRGGCSPIGMKKCFKTYIHHSALDLERITFSGGKIGVQITMNPIALQAIIQAEFENLIK